MSKCKLALYTASIVSFNLVMAILLHTALSPLFAPAKTPLKSTVSTLSVAKQPSAVHQIISPQVIRWVKQALDRGDMDSLLTVHIALDLVMPAEPIGVDGLSAWASKYELTKARGFTESADRTSEGVTLELNSEQLFRLIESSDPRIVGIDITS